MSTQRYFLLFTLLNGQGAVELTFVKEDPILALGDLNALGRVLGLFKLDKSCSPRNIMSILEAPHLYKSSFPQIIHLQDAGILLFPLVCYLELSSVQATYFMTKGEKRFTYPFLEEKKVCLIPLRSAKQHYFIHILFLTQDVA